MGTRFFKTDECVDYYEDNEISHALAVEDRLKKYLKNIDADILDKEKVCLCDEYGCEDSVRDAIRKILEGEKNDTN